MTNRMKDMELIESVVPPLQSTDIELESVEFDEDHHGLDCVWLTFTLARIDSDAELPAFARKIKAFSYSATTELLKAGLQAYPHIDYRFTSLKTL
ncbi:MAG TPA: hypothetical protein VM577_15420 [Anaerovoracaceae bacterium]|nr:hypothetical protein [Anaerovoracaceae bacterium]